MKIGTDGVLLGAWVPLPAGLRSVVDVGAGSGVVSLIVAQRSSMRPDDLYIEGVEIDRGAAEDARANFGASPWARRLAVAEGDFMEMPVRLPHPLMIVSNPPFFDQPLRSPDPRRALARHGGGLNVGTLIRRADGLLDPPDDALAFVAPAARDGEVEYLLHLSRFYPAERVHVLPSPGREPLRTLWYATRRLAPCHTADLPVRDRSGVFSEVYKSLVRELYLNIT